MENELDQLTQLVQRFEGCRLKAYRCPAGVLTIGFGATGKGINHDTVWTQEMADTRLAKDCLGFLVGVRSLCPALRGGALVAAADFAFNLGLGRFRASTLRRRLMADDMAGAAQQLMRWTRASGKVLPGLVRRRSAEVNLLGTGYGN